MIDYEKRFQEARKAIGEIDKEIAILFEKRMEAVKDVAEYKRVNGVPVEDSVREAALLEKNSEMISDDEIRSYYINFQKTTMNLSKDFQHKILDGTRIAYSGDYDITIKRGALSTLSEYCNLNKKALIVTDSGVPYEYAETVSKQFKNNVIKVIPQGEKSKCFDTYRELLEVLNENEFSRADCIVAVGGGVVGDLSGFTAATYMRGIDFYNIPTTLLSQVDSSIGGKTAIDFGGYKNTVGAFYQPKAVIIDPDVLKTLSQRQFNNGLAESIKMAATSDKELFELIEKNDVEDIIDVVIEKSLKIKKAVVEEDEKELGLRRVLNFGHTVGHAIEATAGLSDYLHGECVSMGMLAFCSDSVRDRLINVLTKYNLPINFDFSADEILSALRHDKKAKGNGVNVVFVNEIGSFEFKYLTFEELEKTVKEVYKK